MGVDYVSLGPNQIFLQYYSNNVKQAMVGLGQAARGVRRRMEPIWDAAQNDAAGQGNVEATFQGMSGVISFDLSVFDPAVVVEGFGDDRSLHAGLFADAQAVSVAGFNEIPATGVV